MKIILLQMCVVFLITPVLFTSPGPIDNSSLLLSITLAVLSLAIHIIARATDKNRTLEFFSPDVLFLMGYLVVSFAIPFSLINGIVSESDFKWELMSNQYFNQANGYGVLGIAAFSIGYVSVRNFSLLRSVAREHARLQESAALRVSIIFCILGSLLWMIFLIRNGREFIGGNYTGMSKFDIADLLAFDFTNIFLTLSAAGIVVSYYKKQIDLGWASIALTPYLTLLLSLVLHGDRGMFVSNSVPIVSACYYLKLLNMRSLILLACGGMLVLQTIYVYRDYRENERSLDVLYNSSTFDLTDAIKTQTINFGRSGLLVPISLSYSEIHGNSRGFYTLSGLCQTVPFLQGWQMRTFFTGSEHESSSYNLLTYIVNGKFATSGVGTTTVAEAILDWGFLSVVYTHAALGICAAYLTSLKYSYRTLSGSSFYLYANGLFFILARYGAASSIARSLVFVGLFELLLIFLFLPVERKPS